MLTTYTVVKQHVLSRLGLNPLATRGNQLIDADGKLILALPSSYTLSAAVVGSSSYSHSLLCMSFNPIACSLRTH
jgi:hypothetical protein